MMGKMPEDFEGVMLGDDGNYYKAGDTLPSGVDVPDHVAGETPWKRAGVNGEDNGPKGTKKAPGTPDPAEEGGDVVPPLSEADAAAAGDDAKKTAAKKTAAKKTAAKRSASSQS